MRIDAPSITGSFTLGSVTLPDGNALATTGSNTYSGNQTINGNLVVTGSLTAQQFIVSSSVTYLTESFASGSHKFGDTLDDTHQFTGSMYVSGANAIFAGNVGVGSTGVPSYTLDVTGTGRFTGNLTLGSTTTGVNANIYSSSYGSNGLFQAFGTDGNLKLQMGGLGTTEGFIYTGASNKLTFYSGGALALTLASTGAATFSSSVQAGGQLYLNSGFGTSTPAISIYNNNASSASNISQIEFRVNNTFNGNERVAYITATNPNAAGNNGGQLTFAVSAYGTATTPITALTIASTGAATFSSSVTANTYVEIVGDLRFNSTAADRSIYFRGSAGTPDGNWKMGNYLTPTGATVVTAAATVIDVYNGAGYGFMVRNTSNSPLLQIAGNTGAATFSSSVQADGSSNGFLINQNGGAAGLATYSANNDRAQIAFKYAQNFPSSNNYTRVLDLVSTGDATGGGAIRFLTTVNNATPATTMYLSPSGNVLIGTTTDNGDKLQVNGNIGFVNSGNKINTGSANITTSLTNIGTSTAGIGNMYFLAYYNNVGGAQGSAVIMLSSTAGVTIVSQTNSSGLVITYSASGSQLRANTAAGSLTLGYTQIQI